MLFYCKHINKMLVCIIIIIILACFDNFESIFRIKAYRILDILKQSHMCRVHF